MSSTGRRCSVADVEAHFAFREMLPVCEPTTEVVEVKSDRARLAVRPPHRFRHRNGLKSVVIDRRSGIAFGSLIGIVARIVMFDRFDDRVHFAPSIWSGATVDDVPKHDLELIGGGATGNPGSPSRHRRPGLDPGLCFPFANVPEESIGADKVRADETLDRGNYALTSSASSPPSRSPRHKAA